MWLLDKIAEERIREAIERGELDNLPGAGKPLVLDDDRHVPEDLRAAYRLLKNAGCLPPELELRAEITRVEQLLATLDEPRQRAQALRRLNTLMTRLSLQRGSVVELRLEAQYYDELLARLDKDRTKGSASQPFRPAR